MSLDSYLYNLAVEYLDDEDEAQSFCDTNVYSNELCYKLYSGRFDIDPIFVDFNGQCHSEEGSKVFYNRGEDNLYYLVNWEQY